MKKITIEMESISKKIVKPGCPNCGHDSFFMPISGHMIYKVVSNHDGSDSYLEIFDEDAQHDDIRYTCRNCGGEYLEEEILTRTVEQRAED